MPKAASEPHSSGPGAPESEGEARAAVKGHLVQKRHRMKNLGNVCCRLKKKSCCDRVGPSCPTWLPQSEDARRLSEEHISDLQVEIDRPKTKQQDKRQELERKGCREGMH
ncbi:uncharacterized protein AB9X84_007504 isoform 7-T18 [Acanthopagrus schlegelii]